MSTRESSFPLQLRPRGANPPSSRSIAGKPSSQFVDRLSHDLLVVISVLFVDSAKDSLSTSTLVVQAVLVLPSSSPELNVLVTWRCEGSLDVTFYIREGLGLASCDLSLSSGSLRSEEHCRRRWYQIAEAERTRRQIEREPYSQADQWYGDSEECESVGVPMTERLVPIEIRTLAAERR